MRKSKFSADEIASAVKRFEAGEKVESICAGFNISKNTFYVWRRRYMGLESRMISDLRALEQENVRLRRELVETQKGLETLQELVKDRLVMDERKVLVLQLIKDKNFSEREACEVVGVSRTGFRA